VLPRLCGLLVGDPVTGVWDEPGFELPDSCGLQALRVAVDVPAAASPRTQSTGVSVGIAGRGVVVAGILRERAVKPNPAVSATSDA
jgi:hypothetical protein